MAVVEGGTVKRSGPPARRTPLRRGAPLGRSGALRRAEGGETPREDSAARSGQIRGQGTGLKNTGLKPIPPEVAAEVRSRSKGRCEAKADRRCAGEGHHLHHRAGRGKGRDRADLILDVCLRCHHEIHAHPARSYEVGWMLSRTAPLPEFPAPQPPFATPVG